MTAEEMERAIEFLLQSQAKHDAQLAELRDQVAEITNNVAGLATTVEELAATVEGLVTNVTGLAANVSEMNRIAQMSSESQSQLNEMLTKAITDLAESQRRTEAKVDRLADVAARSNARHDETDARINRLSIAVEKLVESRGDA